MYFFSLFFLLLFQCSLYAATSDQLQFLAADKAIDNNNYSSFKHYFKQVKEDGFKYYLTYKDLKYRFPDVTYNEMHNFFTTYGEDSPLGQKLRIKWLDYLYKNAQYSNVVNFYRDVGDDEVSCDYLNAKAYLQGYNNAVLQEISQMWLKGYSLPKNCDPLFDQLYQSRVYNAELLWQRIALTFEENNINLAAYLIKKLPASQKAWGDLWLNIAKSPATALSTSRFDTSNPYLSQMVLYGLEKLAYQDPATTYYLLNKYRYPVNSYDLNQVKMKAALRAARKDLSQAYNWLNELPLSAVDHNVMEARLHIALASNNWQLVLQAMQNFPEDINEKERWQYWQARALQSLGRTQEARTVFYQAAEKRSYYGFLAADQVNANYNFVHIPTQGSTTELKNLQKNYPALARAIALFEVDYILTARREWEAAIQNLTPKELELAALLAKQAGWYDRAITTIAKVRQFDDIDLRFPLAYQSSIVNYSQNQDIESAWAFGIMRQESVYMKDVRSGAGAVGLMQLLPSTARSVAKRLGMTGFSSGDLINPDINIQLGTGYLKQVLDRFDGHQVLATASYNAGPGRAYRWQPQGSSMEADIWIENIPFSETRKYVRRVMEYTTLFDWKLNRKVSQKLINRIGTIPAK